MSHESFYHQGQGNAYDGGYLAYLENRVTYLENELRTAQSQLAGIRSKRIQFVPFNAQPTRASQGSPQQTGSSPTWKKQLDSFISAIPSENQWDEQRKKAGIDTPARNQLAMKLILGLIHPTSFVDTNNIALISHTALTEDNGLLTRGYHYAAFITSCEDDRNLTMSVVAFQKIIFVSYCVVMLAAGISKQVTNDMMRYYFKRNNDDKTLERYRHGATWVNKCVVALLANGWGHKSWEIFLLRTFLTASMTSDINCSGSRHTLAFTVRPLC